MATIEPLNESVYRFIGRKGGTLRMGLCSDTHVWIDGANHLGSRGNLQLVGESVMLLETLVEELSSSALDLVLHLGDFTCGGGYFGLSPDEFYRAADLNRAAFDQLDMPTFGLPGNHDCPPGVGSWRYVEEQWCLSPKAGQTIDTPYARLVLLNAQGHTPEQVEDVLPEDPIYGWISEAELARLDRELGAADGKPVLLFVHQLLRRWSGNEPWEDFYLVQNAPAVLDVLATHGNVRAVFQGHAHRYDIQNERVGDNNCAFIIAPALIEYPLGWLELELTASELAIRLRRLPLSAWQDRTRQSGAGQAWRAGDVSWHHFTIDLA
jgi:hypothetical protein